MRPGGVIWEHDGQSRGIDKLGSLSGAAAEELTAGGGDVEV